MVKDTKIKAPLSREDVMASGTRIEFFVCPLCCMNRKLHRFARVGVEEKISFDRLDFDRAILQIRYGGGRGSGFYMDRSQSQTLGELVESGEQSDLIDQIRATCKRILEKIGD